MKTKLVKELMVPLSEYATVSEEATLSQAVAALKQTHAQYDRNKYRHRAILVVGPDQKVMGKLDMHAILKALEPKYEEMLSDNGPLHMGFTRKYQKAIFESLKLWQDPLDQICEKAAHAKVSTFMVPPKESETIEPEATLGEALHQLVLGRHQSLLVVHEHRVLGVLRLADVFEAVTDTISSCNC